MQCDTCQTNRATKPTKAGEERLPSGWKRHAGLVWCEGCWHGGFMLRAVTVPVAGPVDGTWEELRQTLGACWGQSTALANWAVTELAKADVVRTPDLARLPKAPAVYLYPGARATCPEMDPQSVTSLLRAVERKYRARRFQVVWLRAESLPNYRYPVPYPVHNQGWSALLGPDGEALVSARLGGRRWTLRLRGGPEFRRQLVAHRTLVEGRAAAGELALYEVPAHGPDHRPGVEVREPGGGRRRPGRLIAKLVLWLPRREPGPRAGVLQLRTAADSFWIYHMEPDGEPKYLHADHVRRWVAEHRRRLARMSDDLKYEKRWPKPVRRGMVEAQEPRLRKMHHRMDTWCHQATAMLAGFAARQHVATVAYDDSVSSYVDSFPWAKLREMLACKLDERGIALETAPEAREREGCAL